MHQALNPLECERKTWVDGIPVHQHSTLAQHPILGRISPPAASSHRPPAPLQAHCLRRAVLAKESLTFHSSHVGHTVLLHALVYRMRPRQLLQLPVQRQRLRATVGASLPGRRASQHRSVELGVQNSQSRGRS
jgi:hypothetical protein